jgi:plastocyanin
VVSVIVLSGCELRDNGDNLVNGKTLFAEKCAACHKLARVPDAKGVVGPDLDQAFQRSVSDGFERSTIKGIVHRQILQPNRERQIDPATGKLLPLMPAKLVKGEDAEDVAAYVASAVAASGKDPGRLANAGKTKPKGVAKAQGGKLDIPVGTGLSYQFASAEAPVGKITVESVNKESIGHNIAIEGGGLDEKGPVVQGGATSSVEVDLKPGEYTFYCSVPGHREGGMVGKLTVK